MSPKESLVVEAPGEPWGALVAVGDQGDDTSQIACAQPTTPRGS